MGSHLLITCHFRQAVYAAPHGACALPQRRHRSQRFALGVRVSARSMRRVTNSRGCTPLAAQSFGNIEIAVKPGRVLISLINHSPFERQEKVDTRKAAAFENAKRFATTTAEPRAFAQRSSPLEFSSWRRRQCTSHRRNRNRPHVSRRSHRESMRPARHSRAPRIRSHGLRSPSSTMTFVS